VLPLQRVEAGEQTPLHTPAPLQTKQLCSVTHWPLWLQLCDRLPLQRVLPGVQTPVQALLAQVN
jgi:hypothetical protein